MNDGGGKSACFDRGRCNSGLEGDVLYMRELQM